MPRREPRFILVVLLVLLTAPAHAAELRLPATAGDLVTRIAAACPACAAIGYVPCGSPDVGWGRRFVPHAFLGAPKRGYLVGFTMTGEEFRTLARATDHRALLDTLRERFARARLVVIADGFADVRVLPPPARVTVAFPKPLHACVHATDTPWGCCVGACKHECCEKALGSPTVELAWQDGTDEIAFHWSHTVGVSWLGRRGGDRRVRYACLTDSRGHLR